ncbi:MAG: hypothetical protein WBP93_23080 [Pyrinomonadaceae bacterium]
MVTRRALPLIAIILFCSLWVKAQSSSANSTDSSMPADKSSSPSTPDAMFGTPIQEMLKRRELRYAEKEYRENLERAREAARLGTELRANYASNKHLGPDDLKKLERLEKITRRIRSEAGGSEGEVTLKEVPQKLETALAQAADISEAMHKGVEKTPRLVISTFVIERANELLEIIRYVRGFTR